LLGIPPGAELGVGEAGAARIAQAFRRQVAAHGAALSGQQDRLAELRWARTELLGRIPRPVTADPSPLTTEAKRRNDAWLHASFWDASVCGECGAAIPPRAEVEQSACAVEYRYAMGHLAGQTGSVDVPYVACSTCARPAAGDVSLGRWRGWCAACGRSMSREKYRRPGPLRRTCSERCHRAARRARRRRGQVDEKTCPVCDEVFSGTRADQVTCSPACRQKAYRRRRALEVGDDHR